MIEKNLTPLMITSIIIFMMGIWTIDVSVSCMNTLGCDGMVGLMNIYTGLEKQNIQNPINTYHIGLVTSILSFAGILFLMVHKIETLEKRLK